METIMPAKLFKQPGTFFGGIRTLMAGLLATLTVTACAPDMFQLGRSTELDAYLSRIARNCGSKTIHGIEVWQLADDDGSLAGDEDFFIDQASMLLYGTITPEQWQADISGYFNDNSALLPNCQPTHRRCPRPIKTSSRRRRRFRVTTDVVGCAGYETGYHPPEVFGLWRRGTFY